MASCRKGDGSHWTIDLLISCKDDKLRYWGEKRRKKTRDRGGSRDVQMQDGLCAMGNSCTACKFTSFIFNHWHLFTSPNLFLSLH